MLKQFPNWLSARWISWLFGGVLLGLMGLGLWLRPDVAASIMQTLKHPLQMVSSQLRMVLGTIQAWGWLGVLGFVGLYIGATVLVLPCTLLTLGAGVIYGPVWGVIYVFLGAFGGSVLAFLLGRYLAQDWIQQQLAKTPIAQNLMFQALRQAVAKGGAKIVLLTRLSPLFPFSLLSYAYALTEVTFQDYVLGFVGCLPGTILYVYIASFAGDLANLGRSSALPPAVRLSQWGVQGLGLVATIVVTVYVTRLALSLI
ncbi:TVP38/TMEM64 family protein, partial [filamentous cyanobacterium LEGE 11480]